MIAAININIKNLNFTSHVMIRTTKPVDLGNDNIHLIMLVSTLFCFSYVVDKKSSDKLTTERSSNTLIITPFGTS